MADQSMKVYIRERPMNRRETSEGARKCVQIFEDTNQISISGAAEFTFDRVIPSTVSQAEVYESCAASIIDRAFAGFNGSILAYGQTGSGKTYTMGTEDKADTDEYQRGIIPRLILAVFDKIKLSESPSSYQVRVSMFEVYGEDILDLLVAGKVKLTIQNETINNLTTVPVSDLAGALQQLAVGCHYRSKASTAMNATSSRSHAVFTIYLERNGEQSFTSKIQLVDLAGSERMSKTEAAGKVMKEGIGINCGLLQIGQVIMALVQKKSHIPYRSGTITRVLQDSLGGNAYSIMIACISPADTNSSESISTLRYANNARQIKNKPIVNKNPNAGEVSELKAKIAMMQSVIDDLRSAKEKGRLSSTSDGMEERAALEEECAALRQDLTKTKFDLANHIMKLGEYGQKIRKLESVNESMSASLAQIKETIAADEGAQGTLAQKIYGVFDSVQMTDEEPMEEVAEVPADVVVEDNYDPGRLVSLQSEMDKLMEQMDRAREKVSVPSAENDRENRKLQRQIEELEAKIAEMEKESRKLDNLSKISESRRQKLLELQKQHAEDQKKLTELRRLQELRKKAEETGRMAVENLKELQRKMVKLTRAQRQEEQRFRLFKAHHEREVQKYEARHKKQEMMVKRQKQIDDQRLRTLQQRLAEATETNKRLKEMKKKRQQPKKKALDISSLLRETLKEFVEEHKSRMICKDLQSQRSELHKRLRELGSTDYGESAAKKKRMSVIGVLSDLNEEQFEAEKAAMQQELEQSIAVVEDQIAQLISYEAERPIHDQINAAELLQNVPESVRDHVRIILDEASNVIIKSIESEIRFKRREAAFTEKKVKLEENEDSLKEQLRQMRTQFANLSETLEMKQMSVAKEINEVLRLVAENEVGDELIGQFTRIKDYFSDVEMGVRKYARRKVGPKYIDGLTPKPVLERSQRKGRNAPDYCEYKRKIVFDEKADTSMSKSDEKENDSEELNRTYSLSPSTNDRTFTLEKTPMKSRTLGPI